MTPESSLRDPEAIKHEMIHKDGLSHNYGMNHTQFNKGLIQVFIRKAKNMLVARVWFCLLARRVPGGMSLSPRGPRGS